MQQRQLPLVLIGAGLPILPALAGESKSYAERLFQFPDIGPLSESNATKALQDPVKATGVEFTADALREIFRLTQGYPYFLQEENVWIKHMVKAFRHLEKVKQEARALGIFTDERELLECPSCGLLSVLVTYPKDSEDMKDSGLRFSQIDENSFVCPACGVTVRTEIEREKAMIVRERGGERYG